ncbi:MAG: EAL domain-containing protein [Eubacterium sp.]|nr:EAL domain-containing protein [Eubacterium sp.]
MTNANIETTYSDLALSLANDYESIYVINSTDDSYVEYTRDTQNDSLSIASSGKNFYVDLISNTRIYVWPSDQEYFMSKFKKENVTQALEAGKSFSINYRLNINGEPVFYHLKTIRGNDHNIVIGVQNVDIQKRRDVEAESYGQIADALASRYEVIYYINIETNEYIRYSASAEYASLGTTAKGADFFADSVNDIKKYLHKDDVDRILYELEKERLLRHLRQSGSLSFNYRQMLGDHSQYVNMIIVRPTSDDIHIVIGVTNIDTQTRRVQSITAENKVFGEISTALAQRYEVIYHVNINTNEYVEYSASEKYAKLGVGANGKDFFADTEINMKKEIYPEDYPMMSVSMEKERLLESLRATGKNVLMYRLILDGRPQYVSLFAVRPKEDSTHIIIAVANIDSAKKMEQEYPEAISSAMDMANHDALTGVLNKRSYVQMEACLDKDISLGNKLAFSIVVFDINGLKEVNDSLGHTSGDTFIQDACSMITDVFKNCKVYRIGGDEFVTLLFDDNYENREKLIDEFKKLQQEHMASDKVTLAYGISDYNPAVDFKVQDVFERADSLMYQNKELLKYDSRSRLLAPESNDQDQDLKFNTLFKSLVSAMTDIEKPDTNLIERLIIELCTMFRLSKAVTRVYRNPREEALGKGETLSCFDLGIKGEVIMFHRVVTSVMSVCTLTLYMSPDEKPLTPDEKWKVDLVMRTVLSFVSRNRLRDIVTELSYYDDNGYKNFRSFQQYFDQILTQKAVVGMTAIRYNLRHFSLVNQEIGRKAGDIVMRNHYNCISSMIGQNGIICRLGGDNFIGLVNTTLLGNIISFLSEAPITYDETESRCVNISTSVGVYSVTQNTNVKDISDIMQYLTTSYMAAQSGGKERIVFYSESLIHNKERSMRVQQLFPEAIRNEEFLVYYQPKVNIDTGEIVGAEALCRWFHDGKLISPGEFIPILEETNDICKLDFYMLDRVCRDIARWIKTGRKSIRVSVNLSRKHMMNVNLLQSLLKTIDRHNIPHSCIEIELTETTTDVDFIDLKRVVNGLQKVGIYTSIDDFGIGYSSLNLLRELPWNVLKVDKSFLPTEGEQTSSSSNIMFKYVVSMAKELGIEVIVEGVETRHQLEILHKNHCELAQGFYFDKPLQVNEFEEKIDKYYTTEAD